jgi:hypothetical protein
MPVVHTGKSQPKIARRIGREWPLQVLFPHCHSLLSYCYQGTTQCAMLPLHPSTQPTMSSPNIQGAWSKSNCRTSPRFSLSPPLSSSLHGSGIRQIHSRRGDTSMPIRALSFASDVVGGSNAASKRHGADPSIASTSAAYKKRRRGM